MGPPASSLLDHTLQIRSPVEQLREEVQEVRDAASAQVDLLEEKLEERKSILQVMADGVWWMVDGDDLSNPSIYILLYACLENWYDFPSFS